MYFHPVPLHFRFSGEIKRTTANILNLFFYIIPFSLLFYTISSSCLCYCKLNFHLFNSVQCTLLSIHHPCLHSGNDSSQKASKVMFLSFVSLFSGVTVVCCPLSEKFYFIYFSLFSSCYSREKVW